MIFTFSIIIRKCCLTTSVLFLQFSTITISLLPLSKITPLSTPSPFTNKRTRHIYEYPHGVYWSHGNSYLDFCSRSLLNRKKRDFRLPVILSSNCVRTLHLFLMDISLKVVGLLIILRVTLKNLFYLF